MNNKILDLIESIPPAFPAMLQVTLVHTLEDHEDIVWDCDWHPCGTQLATCGVEGITVWSVRHTATGEDVWEPYRLPQNHTRTVRCVKWSPNGKHLVSGSFDTTALIWSFLDEEWEPQCVLEGHKNEIKSVSWNSEGNVIATCSRDKSIWLWELNGFEDDAIDYEVIAVLQGHEQDVKCCIFHPQYTTQIFTCSFDNTVRLWIQDIEDEDEWNCEKVFNLHNETVWDLSIQPEGPYGVCSVGADKKLIMWTLDSTLNEFVGRELITPHDLCIYSCAWSVDNLIATVGQDNKLCIFNSKENLFMLQNAHEADINGVAWSQNGRNLCTVSDDTTVKIWGVTYDAMEDSGGHTNISIAGRTTTEDVEMESAENSTAI